MREIDYTIEDWGVIEGWGGLTIGDGGSSFIEYDI